MKPVGLPSERIASVLAAALGVANVLYQAVAAYRTGPEGVLTIGGALAPTLAILLAWWAPGPRLRLAMLVVAMLLELPALVMAGSLIAFAVEVLLIAAVISVPSRATSRAKPRRMSVVL